MKAVVNISHKFSIQETGKFCPSVISFYSYPKKSGLMGNKITSPGWALEYHSKYAGRVFLKTLSNSIEREKQTVHLYAPGSTYWEDARDADYPIQEQYLFFAGAELCGLGRFISPKFKFVRFQDPDNVIGNLFSAAAASCLNHGDDSFWIIQAYLMRMIHHLLRARRLAGFDYLISLQSLSEKTSDFSRMVDEYLRKNIGRCVTLSEIASYMKTSESFLSHKFKAETGISPVSRHTELRIEFAKNLILKGEKLKSVAEMTGYVDECHLSKMFKVTTGVTPRIFKNSSSE